MCDADRSTNTGFFEEAQYRYNSNASNPSCIQATIFWQHGTYSLNDNGSITLFPFGADGRIQVQDPCAAVTNIITYYNQQTLFSDWGIVIDEQTRNYVLKLNRFDGAKMPYVSASFRPDKGLSGVEGGRTRRMLMVDVPPGQAAKHAPHAAADGHQRECLNI